MRMAVEVPYYDRPPPTELLTSMTAGEAGGEVSPFSSLPLSFHFDFLPQLLAIVGAVL
jgi:hypothetical protein